MMGWLGRRFSVSIEVALVVTLALVAGFGVVGGVWAPPPLEDSGIAERVSTMIHAIHAAPAEQRAVIAAAVNDDKFAVRWIAADTVLSAQLEQSADMRASRQFLAELIGPSLRKIVLFDSRSEMAQAAEFQSDIAGNPRLRFMAVACSRDGWVIFFSSSRPFWLNRTTRLALWLAYVALAVIAVQALAAWQLSRPFIKLAEAVRQFGINSPAPPIEVSGPREMREVITAFNAMRAQIENFVNYRVTMLAAISHDLRTPLTRLRLRGEFIEDEEQQARLFRDVDEMQAMVDGALAFFRDAAAEEATTQLDLPGVLKTIANDFADQGVDIPYNGPSHCAYRGRPFALKRAFTNLIENAVKYGAPPEIFLSQDETRIVVTIRDSGPGIPEEALAQVFTPYFRLEPSRNRNSGGVGLGLTAAQSIIRGHGGDILLRNRPEGGLEAEVALPT